MEDNKQTQPIPNYYFWLQDIPTIRARIRGIIRELPFVDWTNAKSLPFDDFLESISQLKHLKLIEERLGNYE